MTDSFSVNGALFSQPIEQIKARLKQRFNPSKNYPHYEGIVNIPADQAYALAEYIMQGKPIGDRNEIPLAINGWKKQSASGKTYLSLSFKPHFKYEKNEVSEACSVNSATQSFAKATDGALVPDMDDIPF
tara:strand:+ start:1223 stop:1612 length:390 start_codon:yes stop_codon:yes gene_type:complete